MSTLKHSAIEGRAVGLRLGAAVGIAGAIGIAIVSSGCTPAATAPTTPSTTAPAAMGSHMAGPQKDVYVEPSALARRPKTTDLSTPQAAIKSYLEWVSYGYRISDSDAPKATMTANQYTYVDGYVQYNVEAGKLIDQQLTSISFGTPSTTPTSTLVPVKESWKYSYLSIKKGNPVLGGPYTVSYSTTYTLVKNAKGQYQVDSIKAMPQGAVK